MRATYAGDIRERVYRVAARQGISDQADLSAHFAASLRQRAARWKKLERGNSGADPSEGFRFRVMRESLFILTLSLCALPSAPT